MVQQQVSGSNQTVHCLSSLQFCASMMRCITDKRWAAVKAMVKKKKKRTEDTLGELLSSNGQIYS